MSNATRFLGLVVAGWVGLRMLGGGGAGDPALVAAPAVASDHRPVAPGASAGAAGPFVPPGVQPPRVSTPARPAPPLPAIPAGAVLTPYGYLLPFAAPHGAMAAHYLPPAPPPHAHHYESVPIPLPRALAAPAPATGAAGGLDPRLVGYSLADGRAIHAAEAAPRAARTNAVPPPVMTTPAARGAADAPDAIDRWQLSAWSFTREAYADGAGSAPGLAPGSMLGGDQAGVRLIYNHDPRLGIAARFSSATGSVRGDEVALGLRYTPSPKLPIAITAERREALGEGPAARSAFALFAEGGVYGRPLGLGLSLDAYAQAGLVGIAERDWFIDGAATATRPLWRNIALGGGVWGAAQPGLERLEIGPRLTMPVWRGVRLHADYRQQLLGSAAPGSGPALTLAADL